MGISLEGTWKVILTDGTAAQMHLPGTLDESGIGHRDVRANQWHPDAALGNAEAKLGSESEVLEQIKYGGIAFARVSLSQIAEQAPEMNVLQLPYLYRDSEHMWRGLDREILRECARESAEYERVLWKDREEQSRQTAIANGTCVSTLSAEEKERGNQVPAY